MNIPEKHSRLARDERGAVLVLGVFMCACMVGALWYVAGIGDAIVYRERLQEATDAAAFSAAALHARGMNLIVLLNLLMACILAVRVTLKAVQAGLGIAAILCAVFPPLMGFEPTVLQGIKLTEDAIRATRQPINNTLKALSRTQNVIKTLVPGAALAGALQVGFKYKPLVRMADAANPAKLTGLPIEEGTADKLCAEAGESVVGLFAWAMPVPLPSMAVEKVRSVIGKTVSTAGAYFCEIGSGPGTPPDLSGEVESVAKQGCDRQKSDKDQALAASEREYQSACRRLGALCDGSAPTGTTKPQTPENERQLSLLKSARDTNRSAADAFDAKKCVQQKKTEAEQKMKNDPNAVKVDPGKGMTPKQVASTFRNGGAEGQLIGLGYGDTKSLNLAPKGVRIGQWAHKQEISVPLSAELGFAQAEYFYDCEGRWNTQSCNGAGRNDQLAMWHFRWRARLRRCNAGLAGFTAAASAAEVFSKNVDQMPALDSVTPDNADVVAQLGRAARDGLLH